jgi:hypothetical protein
MSSLIATSERLELEQDPLFQRREWRVQRFGWILWAAVIGAGLAGLLGPGPLSEREALSADGRLEVRYNRFAHHHHPTVLKVTMQPEDETQDKLRLHLSQSLLDRIEVTRIEPEPTSRELSSNGAWYEFRCEPGLPDAKVVFHYQCNEMGSGGGELRLAGSDSVALEQFVYP